MKTKEFASIKQESRLPRMAGSFGPQVKVGGGRAALRLAPGLFLLASMLAVAAGDPAIDPSATGSAGATAKPSANVAPVFAGRSMDSLDDKQKLGVGDSISFRVLEDREDTKALTISDAGELDVPELGLISAKGKTCKQLAAEIKSKLENTTYYHATVIIGLQLLNKTTSGRRVFVAGQVHQAGPQEIPAGETWTVSKAILAAGGFTEVADKKTVRLVRAHGKGEPATTIHVNVLDVWEKGRTEEDVPIEPEDLIYVPTRSVNFN